MNRPDLSRLQRAATRSHPWSPSHALAALAAALGVAVAARLDPLEALSVELDR